MVLAFHIHFWIKPDKVEEFKTVMANMFRLMAEKEPHSLSRRFEAHYNIPKIENGSDGKDDPLAYVFRALAHLEYYD